jgi:hypothetical protein
VEQELKSAGESEVCKAQGGECQVSGAGIEINQGIRSMQGTRRREVFGAEIFNQGRN